MRSKSAAILACSVLLAGCGATGPQFNPQMVKASSGATLLYVYRPQTVIGFANPDVPFMHLDKQRLTLIRIGGYLAIPVSPGRHTLTTTESLFGNDTGRIRGETSFSISQGSTLYLRYTESFKSLTAIPVGTGVVVESTGNFRFEPVSEGEALAELASTKPLEADKKSP
jgi:hypothetical protein